MAGARVAGGPPAGPFDSLAFPPTCPICDGRRRGLRLLPALPARTPRGRRPGLPPVRDAGRAVRGRPPAAARSAGGKAARVRLGDRARAVSGADPPGLPDAQARPERLARPVGGRGRRRGAVRTASEGRRRPDGLRRSRSRSTGGGGSPGGTTRPRPWPSAWPASSSWRSGRRSAGSSTTPRLALARPDRAGQGHPGGLPGPGGRSDLRGADGPPGRRHPDHRRHFRRRGTGLEEGRRGAGGGGGGGPGGGEAVMGSMCGGLIRIGTRGSHLARWQTGLGRRPPPRGPPGPRRSRSSRSGPRATATATPPWPRSAAPACSPRRSSGPWPTAGSRSPSTASRTSRPPTPPA